jgi:arsenical pump membrane protein
MPHPELATWLILATATLAIIIRPWHLPEALWAVTAAACLVAVGFLPPAAAWRGIRAGTDVYCFLAGMMLLAEIARLHGVFDWLAAGAARAAAGSGERLFTLIYVVGIGVTVLLSNDATAVVLTPAVAAATRAARMRDPLPHLFACAFVANAASFVLPISNPANLVVFGAALPPLAAWLARFGLASVLAIAATYVILRLANARTLREPLAIAVPVPKLSGTGRLAAWSVLGAAGVMLAASAFGEPLGLCTLAAGLLAALVLVLGTGAPVWPILRGVSWGVLPLVAGLFVLVEAASQTGAVTALAAATRHVPGGNLGIGAIVGLVTNLVNNLPAGLLAGSVARAGAASPGTAAAMLIGIDLGPNLSVTGSLATILWLGALRREGITVSAAAFLKLGVLVTPPALLLALLAA